MRNCIRQDKLGNSLVANSEICQQIKMKRFISQLHYLFIVCCKIARGVRHLETYTDGASIFIQASSCQGARERECGNNTCFQGKSHTHTTHTNKRKGTTHILLLGNAILHTFHLLQQCCSNLAEEFNLYKRTDI